MPFRKRATRRLVERVPARQTGQCRVNGVPSGFARLRAWARTLSLAFLAIPSLVQAAKPLPNLYGADELVEMRSYFADQVKTVLSEVVEPALSGKELQIFKTVKMEYPPTAESGDPLDFHVKDSTVVVPTLSSLFLQDLIVAYFWRETKGCGAEYIPLYLNMLKYRSASSLPGKKYVNPIDAFGIPSPNVATLAKQNTEFGVRFPRAYYGAVLFIVAHEIGHIVLQHQGFGSVAKEIAADNFALDIMAREQIDPTGVWMVFLLSSMWVDSAADHPLNGERIRTLGFRLLGHPQLYYPGAPPSDPRVPLLKEIGLKIVDLGDRVDRLAKEQQLPLIALHTDPAEFVSCIPDKSNK